MKFDSQYLHTTGHSEEILPHPIPVIYLPLTEQTRDACRTALLFCDTRISVVFTAGVFRRYRHYLQRDFHCTMQWTTSIPQLCECPDIQRHSVFCNQVYRQVSFNIR